MKDKAINAFFAKYLHMAAPYFPSKKLGHVSPPMSLKFVNSLLQAQRDLE